MYENIYDIIPQYNMIQTKFRGENMTNSEEIYEFNKIDAYNKLKEAINYITGKDREQDFKKFMILCKRSALQGNSHAQYILGIFFEEGILGLERYFETTINTDEKYYEMINPKTALKWYKNLQEEIIKKHNMQLLICILKELV